MQIHVVPGQRGGAMTDLGGGVHVGIEDGAIRLQQKGEYDDRPVSAGGRPTRTVAYDMQVKLTLASIQSLLDVLQSRGFISLTA